MTIIKIFIAFLCKYNLMNLFDLLIKIRTILKTKMEKEWLCFLLSFSFGCIKMFCILLRKPLKTNHIFILPRKFIAIYL